MIFRNENIEPCESCIALNSRLIRLRKELQSIIDYIELKKGPRNFDLIKNWALNALAVDVKFSRNLK